MKKFLVLLMVVVLGCRPESEQYKTCNYDNILGYGFEWGGTANLPIPLHSLNFWTFSDSIYSTDGFFDTVESKLIQIDHIYSFDSDNIIGFTEHLPHMLIKNDTLFGVEFTPDLSEPACFKIQDPILFATEDSVQINQHLSLFYSSKTVKTGAGTFSGNLVLRVDDYMEYIFNKEVGILKIAKYGYNSNGELVKRNVLTLKDYNLY